MHDRFCGIAAFIRPADIIIESGLALATAFIGGPVGLSYESTDPHRVRWESGRGT